MRILMLVATSVATDTRVLREATTLVAAGHSVHIIGRSVPEGFDPGPGITVSSVGTSSMFREEGKPSLSGRQLSAPVRLARWTLLPQHRRSSFERWATGVLADARGRTFDVVHAHDYTALAAAETLSRERHVPFIYDSHELWTGMPREYRPTPLADLRTRRREGELGGRAAAVITVGEGVAEALRGLHGWEDIQVVRNTFPLRHDIPKPLTAPTGLVYAGRVAAYRELETIAAASRRVDLPIEICGPSDGTWLTTFDPGDAQVLPAVSLDQVSDKLLRAGLALVTHSDRWTNHRLALPNKLFHAVSLGVPVVATDVGELAKIVRQYDLGVLYPPGDAEGLANAINTARREYPRFVASVGAVRRKLSWEADAERLVDVYAKLEPLNMEGRV